jgi:hypothetical protein
MQAVNTHIYLHQHALLLLLLLSVCCCVVAAVNPTPSLQHRKALAERIGLTEEQVNVSSSRAAQVAAAAAAELAAAAAAPVANTPVASCNGSTNRCNCTLMLVWH